MAIRVLIMEDDLNILRLYTKVLVKTGYEVQGATSLEEARQQLQENHFDVFVCDMRLGDGLGLDLIEEQQQTLAEQQTQIVVVSAEEQYRLLCEQAGINFFFTKPVSPMAMVRLVDVLSSKAS